MEIYTNWPMISLEKYLSSGTVYLAGGENSVLEVDLGKYKYLSEFDKGQIVMAS